MNIIKNNWFMLKYMLRYSPLYFISILFIKLIMGGTSLLFTIFVKVLFDMVESGKPFINITVAIVIYISINLLSSTLTRLYNILMEKRLKLNFHKNIQTDLYKKVSEVELECYDNPEFYSEYIFTASQVEERCYGVAENVAQLISIVFILPSFIAIVISLEINIILIFIIIIIFSSMFKSIKAKINFKKAQEEVPINRKGDYVSRIFYLIDYAKEIRMSKVDEILHRVYNDSTDDRIKLNKKYGKKISSIDSIEDLISIIAQLVGVDLLLIYKLVVEKSITVGDYGALFVAMGGLRGQIDSLVSCYVNFKAHSLYIEKFKIFMAYEPKIFEKPDAIEIKENFSGLSLDHVSFVYPGTDKYVLKNISLHIKPGEKIAIVGYNGAGKSTLMKLIMRLYDPTSGSINMNDTNIKNYSLQSYRDKFGVIFQDFQLYAASIAENVLADTFDETDKKRIEDSLEMSRLNGKLHTLPNGIHTQITKEFYKDGTNLSGGEAQKIAIARVFAKACDIAILDEPSAALDPISEYELNETIIEGVSEKAVIFISHRLSTTRNADKIYMFENGEIVEEGNHDELMSLRGKYANMFSLQAKRYNEALNKQ